MTSTPPDSNVFDRLEKLLEFPAAFPLKVMGIRVDHFAQEIFELVRTYIPEFDAAAMDMKVSSKGTYLSLTLNLTVQTREQLEGVYKAVSVHPLVKIVL
jgi:uncharacterized protein